MSSSTPLKRKGEQASREEEAPCEGGSALQGESFSREREAEGGGDRQCARQCQRQGEMVSLITFKLGFAVILCDSQNKLFSIL